MPEFVVIEADDPRFDRPAALPEFSGDDSIDPRTVVLPNFSDAHFKVTVAGASDDQLTEQLLSSLRTIEEIGDDNGHKMFVPGEDGLAPRSWHDKMEARDARGGIVGTSAANRTYYSNVRAAERRIAAIRAEIERRSLARKQEAERKVQSERADHQRVLDAAAQEAAQLAAHIEKVAPTLAQIAALAEAIEIAAEQVNLNKRLLGLQSRVADAARHLGVEPPELPPVPEVPEAAKRLFWALHKCGMQTGKQGIG
ncbi:MAG: hypothetical protein GEU87_20155 [Alphaproteobacteria bacterium]|nr:hypothetical protein [Alphaproteobacteria bacterium]